MFTISHDGKLDKPVLCLIPENIYSILDLGCGWGIWGLLLRIQKGYDEKLDGLDVYKPFIDNLNKIKLYDNLFNCDVMDYLKSNLFSFYDLVLCGDLIEHLERKDGLKVIEKLKKSKKVIITTPYITTKKLKKNRNHWSKNDKMFHISGYTPKDFDGYKISLIDIGYIPRYLKPILKIRENIRGKTYSDKEIIAYRGF